MGGGLYSFSENENKGRQTERQTVRPTDRQTDRPSDRQTENKETRMWGTDQYAIKWNRHRCQSSMTVAIVIRICLPKVSYLLLQFLTSLFVQFSSPDHLMSISLTVEMTVRPDVDRTGERQQLRLQDEGWQSSPSYLQLTSGKVMKIAVQLLSNSVHDCTCTG